MYGSPFQLSGASARMKNVDVFPPQRGEQKRWRRDVARYVSRPEGAETAMMIKSMSMSRRDKRFC